MIAKVLGFQDWNVLAARIQSGSAKAALQNDAKHPGTPAREEVAVDANVLDGYVGFYQLNEHAVFTVTRDGTHLVTRLTGQGEVPVYAESKTKFFAKVVDAQISFVPEANGQAGSLILHQGGDTPMPRIDGAGGEQPVGESGDRGRAASPHRGNYEWQTRLRRNECCSCRSDPSSVAKLAARLFRIGRGRVGAVSGSEHPGRGRRGAGDDALCLTESPRPRAAAASACAPARRRISPANRWRRSGDDRATPR